MNELTTNAGALIPISENNGKKAVNARSRKNIWRIGFLFVSLQRPIYENGGITAEQMRFGIFLCLDVNI